MTALADAFKAAFESMGVRVVDITPHPYQAEFDRLARMPVEDVKALWDQYDGCNAPGGFSGEAIHCWLNMEGEGDHCSV